MSDLDPVVLWEMLQTRLEELGVDPVDFMLERALVQRVKMATDAHAVTLLGVESHPQRRRKNQKGESLDDVDLLVHGLGNLAYRSFQGRGNHGMRAWRNCRPAEVHGALILRKLTHVRALEVRL